MERIRTIRPSAGLIARRATAERDDMGNRRSKSLTGSACGAPATHSASVSAALGRLKRGVLLCCWAVGLALMAQIIIWALVTFTEVRWQQATPESAPEETRALIVQNETEDEAPAPGSVFAADPITEPRPEPAGPPIVPSRYDSVFRTGSSLLSGFGTIAVLALVPFIGLGVILATSTATRGVEQAVSAFGWSIVVALLVMPVAQVLGLPWQDGALWSYDALTAQVELLDRVVESDKAQAAVMFYARYLLLPIASIVGVLLVGTRFSSGVEAGLEITENLRLDPELEQEAGNVRPGSLHGSRTAAAMRQVAQSLGDEGSPSIRQPNPGETPKRLI